MRAEATSWWPSESAWPPRRRRHRCTTTTNSDELSLHLAAGKLAMGVLPQRDCLAGDLGRWNLKSSAAWRRFLCASLPCRQHMSLYDALKAPIQIEDLSAMICKFCAMVGRMLCTEIWWHSTPGAATALPSCPLELINADRQTFGHIVLTFVVEELPCFRVISTLRHTVL